MMIYSCDLNSVLQYSLFEYPSSNDSDMFGSFLFLEKKKKPLLWQNICKYKAYCLNHFNYTIQWYKLVYNVHFGRLKLRPH